MKRTKDALRGDNLHDYNKGLVLANLFKNAKGEEWRRLRAVLRTAQKEMETCVV